MSTSGVRAHATPPHSRELSRDQNAVSPESRSPPGQWRLLTAALPCWAITAYMISVPGSSIVVACCAAAAGIALLMLCTIPLLRDRGRAAARLGATCVLLPCAFILLIAAQTQAAERTRAAPELADAASSSASVSFTASLAGFPAHAMSEFGERAWVRADATTSSGSVPVLLWLDGADDADGSDDVRQDWAPGTRVRVRARLAPQPPGDPNAYTGSISSIAALPEQPPLTHLGVVAARLRNLLHGLATEVPGAQLVPGLSVGDTSLVPDTLDDAMRASSLTHVTAVSGSNTGLIVTAALWCATRLGAGRRLRLALAAAALCGFAGLVGPDASVERAAVMAGVLLLGRFGGRASAALPALGLAVLALLVLDPWQALQPGFALSVVATGGILVTAAPLTRGLRRRAHLPSWLALPLGVALAAQLACGPLLLLLQPGIPAVGVLANLAAAPAVPVGTVLGLAAALTAPILPGLAHLLVQLAALPATWIATVATRGATLPGGRWHWPEGPLGACLLAACELLLVLAWALWRGHIGLPRVGRRPLRGPWGVTPVAPLALRRTVSLLVATSLGTITGLTIATPATMRAATPRDWAVVACDVGQGDALLLRHPATPGSVMLVDTGDDPAALTACLSRFGVSRIALLVLSHDDRDHVGALDAVIGRVDRALIAPTVRGERENTRDVVRQLRAAQVPHSIGAQGMAGGLSPNGLTWHVLAPAPGDEPSDANAASLVMLADTGQLRMLLTADTGYEEQSALLRAYRDTGELRADVLKVAHHGSADEDAELPDAVGARWALISVGTDNRYGHPSPEALGVLARAGSRALRTDLDGSIALSPRAGGDTSVWVTGPS